jgi:hypothetical protein
MAARCQRYYTAGQCYVSGYGVTGAGAAQTTYLPVSMRAAPTVTAGANSSVNLSALTFTVLSGSAIAILCTVASTGGWTLNQVFTASADL